jgi:hypothetical protein
VIALSMSRCGSGVGMGRKIVEFHSSIVRAWGHNVLLCVWMLLLEAVVSQPMYAQLRMGANFAGNSYDEKEFYRSRRAHFGRRTSRTEYKHF